MTQQTLTLRPQTLRYAVPAPEAEGLLRPKQRRPGPGGSDHWTQEAHERRARTRAQTMRMQNESLLRKFRQSRYVGLMNNSGRRDKYRDAERVGPARRLLPWEIDEWYARLTEIQQTKVKLVGPLDEKPR